MICVSIGRGRHRHVLAEHKHLVEKGAQLVELRLDYIQKSIDLKRLIEGRPCPVVITIRRERDGGKFTGTEEARQMLLRTAIAAGVEYVDLEEDVAGKIRRYGKTKRIVSHHDFRKTPDNLEEIHAKLCELDPDIVKIATMANRPHDNVRMLRLVNSAKVPTVGMCMGDIGTPSRILAGKFGSPFTYATFHHERVLAPGQLSYEQMTEIYHYDKITADTEVYGVIGDPIAHSLSPIIHNAAFRAMGMNKVYVPFRIPREELANFMEDARELGIHGLSVTIPHKEEIIKRLTWVEGTARAIGAVNTVRFDYPAVIEGHNTDYQAAMDSLATAMGKLPIGGCTALVLGAGGAAKAIAHGLKRKGAEVIIASRTSERAEALADGLGCRAIDWDQRHNVPIDILVNCTPVGMHPNVDESPYDKHSLKPSMLVFDAVYNPESTMLIKDARERKCTIVTGVEMFVRQAGLQFQLFTEKPPPTELMRETLKKTIGAAKL
jgi:3-dehydroquinate dehydratase/shikimate dehydrogenase